MSKQAFEIPKEEKYGVVADILLGIGFHVISGRIKDDARHHDRQGGSATKREMALLRIEDVCERKDIILTDAWLKAISWGAEKDRERERKKEVTPENSKKTVSDVGAYYTILMITGALLDAVIRKNHEEELAALGPEVDEEKLAALTKKHKEAELTPYKFAEEHVLTDFKI